MAKNKNFIPSSSPDKPLKERGDGPYKTIRQGQATNAIAKMKTKGLTTIDYNGRAATLVNDVRIFIQNYNELTDKIKPSAKLLLDALVITATDNGQKSSLIKLPLKEYMNMRGLKDAKSARNQVKNDLETLASLCVSYREKKRGKDGDWLDITLHGGQKGLMKGVIIFEFSQSFYNVLMGYPVMQYPKEILSFNLRYNPNSPHFLRKISEHKNMNYFKANADIIKVKTLIDSSPEMPTYNEIKGKGQIEQRIRQPFERDMDHIKSFRWNYCGKNGAKIDPPKSYDDFIESKVKIIWGEYPERPKKKPSKKKA